MEAAEYYRCLICDDSVHILERSIHLIDEHDFQPIRQPANHDTIEELFVPDTILVKTPFVEDGIVFRSGTI